MSSTTLSIAGYLLTGVFAVLFPTIMPTITSGLGLTMAAAGLLYPARAVGSLIGASVGGLFCDRAGGKTLLTGSAGLLMIGLAVAAGAPHWSQFLVAFFLAGIAQGALTTGINAVTAEASGQQGARALNQLHGVYSVGAALSPVVVGWFINSGAGWRSVLWYLAAIWLVFTCVSWLTKYPCEVSGSAKKATSLGLLFRHPVLLFAGAVAFSYNGVAWSLIGWINTYMQRDAGLPAFLSAGMITVFYTALAGGRFACASLAARYGNDKILLVCALGSALSYPLVLIQHWPLVAVLGTLGSGLFLSGLYPTALACAARFSPGNAGAIAGALSTAMTLGTMIPPWWTGIVAEYLGLHGALSLNYFMIILLVWAAWQMSLQIKKPITDNGSPQVAGNIRSV